jgi:hypothetical protein
MEYSLSDSDIRNLTDNNVSVLTYSEVIENGLIKSLLESPSKCIIMLVRQQPTYGHWICIFIKENGKEKGIHIVDSYGNTPDSKQWKKGINDTVLEELGQEKPYLLEQLYNSGFDMYYNEYALQDLDKNVNSCGRHAVCRSYFTDLDTDEYYNMINRIIDDIPFINTPDEVVLTLTSE